MAHNSTLVAAAPALGRVAQGRALAISFLMLTALLLALTLWSRAQTLGAPRTSDWLAAGVTIVGMVFFWRGSRVARWLAVALFGASGLLLLTLGISYGSAWSVSWSFLYFAAVGCLLRPAIADFQAAQRTRGRAPYSPP